LGGDDIEGAGAGWMVVLILFGRLTRAIMRSKADMPDVIITKEARYPILSAWLPPNN
jgi:hypothetical protein